MAQGGVDTSPTTPLFPSLEDPVNPLSPKVLKPSTPRKEKFSWLPLIRNEDEVEIEILPDNLSILDAGLKVELGDDDHSIQEGETQEHLDPRSLTEPGISECIDTLKNWINRFLTMERVQLNDINTDLRDGQVFALVYEKIMGCTPVALPCGEYVQSRERQQRNLEFIIDLINRELGLAEEQIKWKTTLLFMGEVLNSLRILIKINQYCLSVGRPAPELPTELKVKTLRIKKVEAGLQCERRSINIIGESVIGKRDAFDTLIDHNPQKFKVVQNAMLNFVNSSLEPLGQKVEKLEEFSEGWKLCILIGCLQGFFIPLYEYNIKPESKEEMLENVELCFRLLKESGIEPNNRPGEVVSGDIKSILRIIYNLYLKYKHNTASSPS